MKTSWWLTLATTVVVVCPARAQFPDLFELGSQYLPGVPVAVPGSDDARAQITSYDVVLNLPIVLGETSFLVPGVAYHAEAVSYAGLPDGFTDLRAFHGIDLSLLYVQLLSPKWSLALRVAPGLAGDLTQVDRRTLRLSGAALANYAANDCLVLGAGVIASYGFGEFLVLPGLYASWKANDWLLLETMLPAFARVTATPIEGFEITLRADVAGNTYAVRDQRVLDTCGGDCMDHLAYSVVAVTAGVSVRLWESMWLSAAGGYTVYRRFEPFTRDNALTDDGAQTLPNVPLVRVGLTYRLPTSDGK